jgi:RecJ-like exonuclease
MKKHADRSFLLPIRLISRAKEFGIPIDDLQNMLQRSARVTHEKGNRRFHDYIFSVEGKRVLNISHCPEAELDDEPEEFHSCDTCHDTHRVQVFNECHRCQGEGCSKCDEGLVPATIPCPSCSKQKTLFKRRR